MQHPLFFCELARDVRRALLFAVLCLPGFVSLPSHAQMLVPEPSDILGHDLGDRFTRHHAVVDFMEAMAEAVPHWTLETYGRTSEHRPLLGLVMSSPENMARIEELAAHNMRRVQEGVDSGDRVAWVYLSYNVHGNEAVCTEAAMATVHALATTHSHLLDRAVVVLDPCVNPDGRDRYVSFQDQSTTERVNADTWAWEHDEPWPGGRANHYLFDMNRDLAWQTQRETQARTAFYRRWMPQVHVDFHEQGVNSPYYFAPAAEPYHAIITPWQRECQGHIGTNNAKYFDQRGALYFTREVFDLLYPSYGDTWPMFQGAVGMTYEQGGSGRAGRAVETAVGDTLTLAYRIQNHTESGLATIESAGMHVDRMLKEFAAYHRRNLEEPWGDYTGYVIASNNGAEKLAWFTQLMDRNGISYGRASSGFKASGWDYTTSSATRLNVSAGDMVVDARQAQSGLLQVLMDPNPALSDSLTYDITTWALPYAYGLDAHALTSNVPPLAAWTAPQGGSNAEGGESAPAYAHLLHYQTDLGTPALASLLNAGVVVRVARRPILVQGVTHPRGTLVITRRNNETLWPDIEGILDEACLGIPGIQRTRLSSGLVTEGPDLGADDVKHIPAPRVAVVMGDEVSSLGFGEVWHHFEEVWHYPITPIRGLDRLVGRDAIANYDVVVLPRGWYDLGEGEEETLSGWVRDGGQLILLEGACTLGLDRWGLSRDAGEEDRNQRTDEREAHNEADRYAPFALSERRGISRDIPGAVYDVQLDPTHPLAYGYGDTFRSIKTSSQRFAHLERGHNVGIIRGDTQPVSGFAGARANQGLRESLSFGVHDMGQGHVVYLADNVLFRAFWKDGHKLFANALFFGAAM